jgi:hypothetical protein
MGEGVTRTERKAWHWFWPCFLGLLVLLTLGVRYAEPVRDGDLWWQMAYGRHLIEHRTLVPDHTVFAWAPSENISIYCAWLSEIFLYLLHQVGGLPALFAFRYLCLLIFVLAVWLQARSLGVAGHPMTWLICLLGVLMSQSAAYIKPEIFSYVLMTLTVFLWWHIKSSGDRAWRACYLFPVLMVVWVNTHGGFLFGAAFLVVMGVGEVLNAFLSPKVALPPRVRRHLLVALFLSGLAILVTPYGWSYPSYLIPALLSKKLEEFRVIQAYASSLDPRAAHFHYKDYLILSGLILLGLMLPQLKRRRPDWAVILANLAFALLYVRYLRTTYYLVPVFSFSAVHLLARGPSWLRPKGRATSFGLAGSIALLCVLLGARSGFDALCKPYEHRWFGFGVSYQNPVEEAEFIRTHLAVDRVGNDYSGGGYLLWALWPETKAMIDPRQFPFKKWLNTYGAFHSGRSVGSFVREYPCEVWCIRYACRPVITWFMQSPDWKVAFYGASAAVFVKKDHPGMEGKPRAGEGIKEIRNIDQAILVLTFASTIHDWNHARVVSAGMKERFRCPNQKQKAQAAADWLGRRIKAFYQGDRGRSVGVRVRTE